MLLETRNRLKKDYYWFSAEWSHLIEQIVWRSFPNFCSDPISRDPREFRIHGCHHVGTRVHAAEETESERLRSEDVSDGPHPSQATRRAIG